MIKDDNIDLTIDLKFGIPQTRTANMGIFEVVEAIRKIPWKNRPIKSEDWNRQYRRMKGDWFSDELGVTVRRTFNNGWFFLGKIKDYIFNDFCYEYGLEDPSLLKTCPECNRKILTKSQYIPCEKCKLKRYYNETKEHLFPKNLNLYRPNDVTQYTYIPWLHADRDWQTREFRHPDYIVNSLK